MLRTENVLCGLGDNVVGDVDVSVLGMFSADTEADDEAVVQ